MTTTTKGRTFAVNEAAWKAAIDELVKLSEEHADLLDACRAALVQIKQDNDERKVEAAMRGTENMLRYVLAKVEGGQP